MSIAILLDPAARCLGRVSTAQYSGSPKLVFGASLLVWIVWFFITFYIWFAAGQANLLASLEFSWSFGTTFSILSKSHLETIKRHQGEPRLNDAELAVLIIPIGSIVRTYRTKRAEA